MYCRLLLRRNEYSPMLITKGRLIMLNIQSDMIKSLCFFIHPIVISTHGPVGSSSRFCQVSGFILTYAFEASGKWASCPCCGHRLRLIYPRYRYSSHCHPYRTLYIQIIWTGKSGRTLSISSPCLSGLGHCSSYNGLTCISESTWCVRDTRDLLCASCQAILVSIGLKLGAALHDSDHYIGSLYRNLYLCQG